MTSPRRAATEQVEVITLDSDSPRRAAGAGALWPFVRRTIAPAALVGVLAVSTVLTFVPVDAGMSVADPLHQAEVELGVSRSREREPIKDLPTGDPSPTAVSSIAPVPSPSVVPSTTPTVATASPTPSPDTVTPSPSSAAETPVAASAVPAETAEATPSEPPVESTTPAPEPTPEVDWSVLGAQTGTVWATASVNVRTGPGTQHDVVTTLRSGDDVTATDTTADGWQQVVVGDGAGWVKGTYLDDEEPEATTSGINTSACSSVSGSTSGMTANAIQVRNAVCNAFPNVSSIGGYRSGGGSYHSSGRAIDVMISGEAGWEIARWARANAGQLGVIEVIYSQQIWTSQRSGDGWRSMSDRGSASANHYDHVHISVR